MQNQRRDGWDKADIILKPVGGLLTALAVAALGFFGSRALDRRQAEDSNVRLYTELINKREESEAAFRKEMFSSIFREFLKPPTVGYEQQVINMELLSYNFNEDIDLAPLLKRLYSQINDSQEARSKEYFARLEKTSNEIKSRQLATLEDGGGKLDTTIPVDQLGKHPEGIKVIDGSLSLHPKGLDLSDPTLQTAHFKVEALMVDRARKEIRVKLEVATPSRNINATKGQETDTLYAVFSISLFDFPMTNNIRLPYGQRCAIVLRSFGDEAAQITLVYFAENWRAGRVVDMARILNVHP